MARRRSLLGLRYVLIASLIALASLGSSVDMAWSQEKIARVGVLAFRGTDAAKTRWEPLLRYLSASIPNWRFELVPVTLITAPERLEANALDFIITNPGHYVSLAERFQLSALATRERRHLNQKSGLLNYGTAIFTRSDRDEIQTLSDLSGQTLAAVSPEAFGGFQMAWFEFHRQGIDPFAALKTIRYIGFPQDQIIADVLEGRADAGAVRSGLLETLVHEGRLDLSKVKVLLGNAQTSYPFLISGRLYPEWPFAARLGTDRRLAEAVTRALLMTQDPVLAARNGLLDLWSAPLSYEGVRSVVSAYRSRRESTKNEPSLFGSDLFWLVFAAAAGALGLAAGYSIRRTSANVGATTVAGADAQNGDDAAFDQHKSRFEALTRREREVLRLICGGEPTKRIAETLHISPKTVEYHRSNLLQKTEAGSTPRLVQLATKLGFDQVPI